MRLIVLIFSSICLTGCQTLSGHYQENKGHIKAVCDDIMGSNVSKESKTYKRCLAQLETAQASLDTKDWVQAGVITQWGLWGFMLLLWIIGISATAGR